MEQPLWGTLSHCSKRKTDSANRSLTLKASVWQWPTWFLVVFLWLMQATWLLLSSTGLRYISLIFIWWYSVESRHFQTMTEACNWAWQRTSVFFLNTFTPWGWRSRHKVKTVFVYNSRHFLKAFTSSLYAVSVFILSIILTQSVKKLTVGSFHFLVSMICPLPVYEVSSLTVIRSQTLDSDCNL